MIRQEDKTNKLTFAVCDDRLRDRMRVQELIEQYARANDLNVEVRLFESGESLLCAMRSEGFTVVFLDVFMDAMSGIETARELRKFSRCAIVFITTSPDYALEGFELNAVHYIVKPCGYEAVSAALARCVEVANALNKTVEIKVGRENMVLRQSDIWYIEVYGNRCNVYTPTGVFETYTPLSVLYEKLDPNQFLHPQRSYIVNLSYINGIPTSVLTLKNGVQISISRTERVSVKKRYLDYLMEITRGGGV